jgi:hypothetical protein
MRPQTRSCAASARPSGPSARTLELALSAWVARRRQSALKPSPRACLDSALDGARAALEALADLDDDAFIEVEIKQPRATRAALPVGYLRQYLAAEFVPGREVLLFDSDKEVTAGIAACAMSAATCTSCST